MTDAEYLAWDELSDDEKTVICDGYADELSELQLRERIYRQHADLEPGELEPLTAADCLRLGLLKGTEVRND